MDKLATQLRALQLFAHNAHNVASGPSCLADHSFLGDLYEAYADAYDSVVERAIGLGESFDLAALQANAAKALDGVAKTNEEAFEWLLEQETRLCAMIESLMPECTAGTQNLIAGIADESEVRQYKLKQRLS